MTKKVIGIVCLIIGTAAFLLANHIANEVAFGNALVRSGQQSLDSVNYATDKSPLTKKFGRGLSKPVQQKIDEGSAELKQFNTISKGLHIGGIVLALTGVGLLVLSFRKRL